MALKMPAEDLAPGAKTPTTQPKMPAASTQSVDQELMAAWAPFLNDSELGPILRRAANEGWTQQRLQSEIMATNWYRTRSVTQREWDTQAQTDPTTANAAIRGKADEIKADVFAKGLTMSDQAAVDIAKMALRNGWNAAQVNGAVTAEVAKTGGSKLMQGAAALTVGQLASAYGVVMTDGAKQKWATDLALGNTNKDAFTAWLAQTAAGYYPAFAKELKAGQTLAQMADPYVAIASKILDIPPEQIDLTDPKWNAAINAVDDKGVRRPLSLLEWSQTLRNNPAYGYQYTKGAKDNAYAMAETLKQMFGR